MPVAPAESRYGNWQSTHVTRDDASHPSLLETVWGVGYRLRA